MYGFAAGAETGDCLENEEANYTVLASADGKRLQLQKVSEEHVGRWETFKNEI